MITQFQDLDALLEKLRAAQGPITTPFADSTLRIIAAYYPTDYNAVSRTCLIGLRLNANGTPAENHLTILANTAEVLHGIGGTEPTIRHRLSIDDIIGMARSVHGRPSWVSLRRCIAYAIQAAWRYGVEPDYTSVIRFMQQVVNDGSLVRDLSGGEIVSYSRWLGRPEHTNIELYFCMALSAHINAGHTSAAKGTLVNAA